jgi:hypothetical protein
MAFPVLKEALIGRVVGIFQAEDKPAQLAGSRPAM